MPVPLEAQIACVVRELSYRERCYARWVREGRITQEKVNYELMAMRAVLDTLRAVDARTRLI